jgi:hypothetical protein
VNLRSQTNKSSIILHQIKFFFSPFLLCCGLINKIFIIIPERRKEEEIEAAVFIIL